MYLFLVLLYSCFLQESVTKCNLHKTGHGKAGNYVRKYHKSVTLMADNIWCSTLNFNINFLGTVVP
jgi:hypothetical protein